MTQTRGAALVLAGLLLLAGCGVADGSVRSDAAAGTEAGGIPAPARTGTPAASQRVTFVPTRVTLPSGDVVTITPAVTTRGALEVPEAAGTAGWWDGSARVNEAFGSVVIAGHVDTAANGLADFAELLEVTKGDVVTVSGANGSLTYRVATVASIDKDALATTGDALSQKGSHRLVLITCTGTWNPATRHYDRNLVVTAEPLGEVVTP